MEHCFSIFALRPPGQEKAMVVTATNVSDRISAVAVLQEVMKAFGGGAGGRADLASGGLSDASCLEDLIKESRVRVERAVSEVKERG